MVRLFASLMISCLLLSIVCTAAAPPAPADIDIAGPDGTKLKATFYGAGKPGPGVMLFHQCNRDRKMWADVAPKLAAAGINVLTLDMRGFGESGGDSYTNGSPQLRGEYVNQKWPGDVDVAYRYLTSQKNVKKDIIGAGGASCGVNESVQLARRHPEVKSLVLLSGFTNRDGRLFLKQAAGIPIFGSAADDDDGAVDQLVWLLSLSPNPANTFQHYATGGHGIEMFAPHPELTGFIQNWFETTLVKTPGKAPANKNASFRGSSILEAIDAPGGAAKAEEMLTKAREKDPKATPFSEALVNQIGYEHIQAKDNEGAIEILKLNAKAFPDSPNVYDSLSDAYLAAGQKDEAKRYAMTALQKLESDTTDTDAVKQAIRESAEQKVK